METIRRTAVAVAAAAISEIMPGSELLGGGETSTGFFYQFFYSHPLPPEINKMLEERMRQLIREDRPIREMDMVACSAAELFRKEGHSAAVNTLEDAEPKELVSVLKLGNFYDLQSGPFCPSIREIGAFKITGWKFLGDGEYRIEGCAYRSKEELKLFLRKLSKYEDQNHIARGSQLQYWQNSSDGLLWLPLGLKARREVIKKIVDVLCASSKEVRGTEKAVSRYEMQGSIWQLVERVADPEGDCGLLEEGCQSYVEQTIYCSEQDLKDRLSSLLQLIHKTLIILGFPSSIGLRGRRLGGKGLKLLEQALSAAGLQANFKADERDALRLEWTVEDGLGRHHPVMELRLEPRLAWKASIERILALLLEQTEPKSRTFELEN